MYITCDTAVFKIDMRQTSAKPLNMQMVFVCVQFLLGFIHITCLHLYKGLTFSNIRIVLNLNLVVLLSQLCVNVESLNTESDYEVFNFKQ